MMHSAPKKVTKRKINAVQEVDIESKVKKVGGLLLGCSCDLSSVSLGVGGFAELVY